MPLQFTAAKATDASLADKEPSTAKERDLLHYDDASVSYASSPDLPVNSTMNFHCERVTAATASWRLAFAGCQNWNQKIDQHENFDRTET